MQTNRHHQLKGKLKGFWEYEVDGATLTGDVLIHEPQLEVPTPPR